MEQEPLNTLCGEKEKPTPADDLKGELADLQARIEHIEMTLALLSENERGRGFISWLLRKLALVPKG